MRNRSYIFIFLIITIFLGCKDFKIQRYSPIVKNGVVNFQDWELSQNPILPLDGEWEFYSLDPNKTNQKVSIKVPGTWNKYMGGSGNGVGIYKLVLVFPNEKFIEANNLAIQMNDISTAYKLKVDGEIIHTKGKVGFFKEEMIPSYKRNTILIPNINLSSKVEIEILVSNYYHPKGGIRSSLYIGRWQDLIQKEKNNLIIMWVLVGATFIISIYHMIVYSLRNIDKSIFWFSILSFQVGCRAIFDSSVFVYSILPDSYWTIIHKVDIITFVCTIPLFSLFLHSIFYKDFNKYLLSLFVIVSTAVIISVIILPSSIYMEIISYFQLIVFFGILYFVNILLIAVKRKREGSILFLIGCIILFATAINDILNQMRIIFTGYYANWGFLAFLFSQATLLAKKFTNAFNTMEELKLNLESRVLERTKDLKNAKKKAEDANNVKDKFISIISHDLCDPIASVIGILNIVIEEFNKLTNEEKLDYLEKARASSSHSLEMITQLLNFNRLSTGSIKTVLSDFDIYAEVDGIINKLFLIAKQKNIRVINLIPIGMNIHSDKTLIGEIFYNLLSNAIKFSNLNTKVTIEGKFSKDCWEFAVVDEGVGINPTILSNIFRRDIKTSTRGTQGEEGSGLGLPLTYEIIEAIGGEIHVDSSVEWGTRFTIRIPKSNS